MKIILKGNPLSTQSCYWMSWKIKYMTKKAKELKKSYIEQIKEQYHWPVLDDKLQLDIKLFFWDKRVRDWDNYGKLSMDSMTWYIYEDDSQIKKATVELFYDKNNPRIEITIIDYDLVYAS